MKVAMISRSEMWHRWQQSTLTQCWTDSDFSSAGAVNLFLSYGRRQEQQLIYEPAPGGVMQFQP